MLRAHLLPTLGMHDKRKEEKYGNDAEKARANTNCEALHGFGGFGPDGNGCGVPVSSRAGS